MPGSPGASRQRDSAVGPPREAKAGATQKVDLAHGLTVNWTEFPIGLSRELQNLGDTDKGVEIELVDLLPFHQRQDIPSRRVHDICSRPPAREFA